MLKKHYPATHDTPNGIVSGTEPDSSMKGKVVKKSWHNKVAPAFPEAIADFNIIKNFIYVENQVKEDMIDVTCFPEIMKVAEVRRGLDLGLEERRFIQVRRVRVRDSFAKYFGLDPAQGYPEDVPTVGFGGSGGDIRAMFGVLGYAQEMKRTGLWDLFMYVAGVSGAC
jgi:phospholipase A2